MEAIAYEDKIVERFIKVQAMATNTGATEGERSAFQKKLEKMETETPGLTAHVETEMQKIRSKEQANDWIFRHTGQTPMPEPDATASWFEKAVFRVYKWGLDKATQGMTDDEWAQLNDEFAPKKRKKKAQPSGLKEVFWERIGVGEISAQTDETGEFIHLDMDIPVEVWDKIMSAKTGSTRFCEWIEDLMEDE